ncbi:MAG: hypothetical protein ACE145_05355 [Terriglobia bacterium]
MAKVGYGATYGFFIGLVSVILAGLFVYKSTRLVMRLRDDPPPQYLEFPVNWSAPRRTSEERLARAYWRCAVLLSRGQYVFGQRLPEEPPPGFSVDAKSYPSLGESPAAARARYWRKIQEVWTEPAAWHEVYEWHTDWFFRASNY